MIFLASFGTFSRWRKLINVLNQNNDENVSDSFNSMIKRKDKQQRFYHINDVNRFKSKRFVVTRTLTIERKVSWFAIRNCSVRIETNIFFCSFFSEWNENEEKSISSIVLPINKRSSLNQMRFFSVSKFFFIDQIKNIKFDCHWNRRISPQIIKNRSLFQHAFLIEKRFTNRMKSNEYFYIFHRFVHDEISDDDQNETRDDHRPTETNKNQCPT